jgi:hypothetical protein
MTVRKWDVDLPDVDPDGICEAQTTAGAANLVLNGALCDVGTAGEFLFTDSYPFTGGVQLVFDSAGDISTVVFTITGLDPEGNAQSATVTNVTTTEVETTTYWSKVTQIAADAEVTSNVTVGTVDEVVTNAFPMNWQSPEPYTAAALGLSGTINYSMEESFDETRSASVSVWYGFQASKTADLVAEFARHALVGRLKVNSYSSGAELQFYISGQ